MGSRIFYCKQLPEEEAQKIYQTLSYYFDRRGLRDDVFSPEHSRFLVLGGKQLYRVDVHYTSQSPLATLEFAVEFVGCDPPQEITDFVKQFDLRKNNKE